METAMTAHKKLTCVAGEWTFTMVIRQVAVLGASTGIYKESGIPARLGITYTN